MIVGDDGDIWIYEFFGVRGNIINKEIYSVRIRYQINTFLLSVCLCVSHNSRITTTTTKKRITAQ